MFLCHLEDFFLSVTSNKSEQAKFIFFAMPQRSQDLILEDTELQIAVTVEKRREKRRKRRKKETGGERVGGKGRGGREKGVREGGEEG